MGSSHQTRLKSTEHTAMDASRVWYNVPITITRTNGETNSPKKVRWSDNLTQASPTTTIMSTRRPSTARLSSRKLSSKLSILTTRTTGSQTRRNYPSTCGTITLTFRIQETYLQSLCI